MSAPIRVYVNDRAVELPGGSTVVDAAHAADQDLAALLAQGAALATDGRGLPLGAGTVLRPGAIVRIIVSARRPDAARGGADADA